MLPESYSIILALAAATAAGLIGSFALMRRMTLAGDVISHVALPGLGLAILFDIYPLLGAAASLFLGTLLIWQLERQTGLTVESMIGVVFAGSLAVGALLTTDEELVDALFGSFGALTIEEFAVGMFAALLVVLFILKYKDQLIIALFSPELASSTGINLRRLNLYFLLTFSLTILLGLRFLGALLMGSLIIIPAAVGRQITHTLHNFLAASTLASVVSVALGLFIISRYALPADHLGPVVVTVTAALFALSLLKKKQ